MSTFGGGGFARFLVKPAESGANCTAALPPCVSVVVASASCRGRPARLASLQVFSRPV